MINQQILNYLNDNKDKYPIDVLKTELVKAGYSAEDVSDSINHLQNLNTITPEQPVVEKEPAAAATEDTEPTPVETQEAPAQTEPEPSPINPEPEQVPVTAPTEDQASIVDEPETVTSESITESSEPEVVSQPQQAEEMGAMHIPEPVATEPEPVQPVAEAPAQTPVTDAQILNPILNKIKFNFKTNGKFDPLFGRNLKFYADIVMMATLAGIAWLLINFVFSFVPLISVFFAVFGYPLTLLLMAAIPAYIGYKVYLKNEPFIVSIVAGVLSGAVLGFSWGVFSFIKGLVQANAYTTTTDSVFLFVGIITTTIYLALSSAAVSVLSYYVVKAVKQKKA